MIGTTTEQVTLFDQWEEEFRPRLGHTARWEGFSYIVKDQLERLVPVIVETGCMRQEGNWAGDGQSTRVWDWIVGKKQGYGCSVDLDEGAVALARRECAKVKVSCRDSVTFLRELTAWVKPTLLYLDSYDYSPGKELNAAVHNLAELTAAWDRLPSGCLIACDDNFSVDKGKPVLVRYMLQLLGMTPVVDSYIVVWKKP